MQSLFDEAIELLSDVRVLSELEGEEIVNLMVETFPFNHHGVGSVNWQAIMGHIDLKSPADILTLPNYSADNKYYVVWNDASVPVIATKLSDIVTYFDDITAVSFDTWLFSPEQHQLVEVSFQKFKATV